jgi:GTP-binding protein
MENKIYFVKSAFNLKDVPRIELPQIILCGRSNVGKSTFINSLYNKKNLAKVSNTPGKTRSINFYSVNDKYYLVDLPGYGYARISLSEQEKWGMLIKDFFEKFNQNSVVFHFIDSRHKPTETDSLLRDLTNSFSIPYVVILNKADKLSQSELAAAKREIKIFSKDLTFDENLFFYSAVKGNYRKDILKKIKEIVN